MLSEYSWLRKKLILLLCSNLKEFALFCIQPSRIVDSASVLLHSNKVRLLIGSTYKDTKIDLN